MRQTTNLVTYLTSCQIKCLFGYWSTK